MNETSPEFASSAAERTADTGMNTCLVAANMPDAAMEIRIAIFTLQCNKPMTEILRKRGHREAALAIIRPPVKLDKPFIRFITF